MSKLEAMVVRKNWSNDMRKKEHYKSSPFYKLYNQVQLCNPELTNMSRVISEFITVKWIPLCQSHQMFRDSSDFDLSLISFSGSKLTGFEWNQIDKVPYSLLAIACIFPPLSPRKIYTVYNKILKWLLGLCNLMLKKDTRMKMN